MNFQSLIICVNAIEDLEPVPAPSSKTSFLTREDESGNNEYGDDRDQTIPMQVDDDQTIPMQVDENQTIPMQADGDQTSPIQFDRFPGNRYHEDCTSRKIDTNCFGASSKF